jgi:hypothetical protein
MADGYNQINYAYNIQYYLHHAISRLIGLIIRQSPSKTRSNDLYCSHACAIARGTVITAALFSSDLESFLLNVRFITRSEEGILSSFINTISVKFLYANIIQIKQRNGQLTLFIKESSA